MLGRRKRLSVRGFAAVAVGAVASLSMAACGGSSSSGGGGNQDLSFGTQPVIAYGMFDVAQRNGYYTKRNVKVNLLSFDSGSPELEAMSGGNIQAGTMGATPALTAAAAGLIKNLKIISLTDNPSGGYSILSSRELTASPISRVRL